MIVSILFRHMTPATAEGIRSPQKPESPGWRYTTPDFIVDNGTPEVAWPNEMTGAESAAIATAMPAAKSLEATTVAVATAPLRPTAPAVTISPIPACMENHQRSGLIVDRRRWRTVGRWRIDGLGIDRLRRRHVLRSVNRLRRRRIIDGCRRIINRRGPENGHADVNTEPEAVRFGG